MKHLKELEETKNSNFLVDLTYKNDIILAVMKINNRSKTGNSKSNNYKAFNAFLVETPRGLKVVGAFGSDSIDTPEDKWKRLDSRLFTRALRGQKLVTH